MKKPGGVALIEATLGDPMKGAGTQATDPDESEEGGEGELELHLRAYNKALRSGNMSEAATAFRAAVNACGGYSEPGDMME